MKRLAVNLIFVLALWAVLVFGQALGGIFFFKGIPPVPDDGPLSAGQAVLVVGLVDAVILTALANAMRTQGRMLALTLGVVLFGVQTLQALIETIIFNRDIGMSSRELAAFAEAALLRDAWAALVIAILWKGESAASDRLRGLPWKVPLIGAFYVICYFTAGALIAWPSAAVRAYYAHVGQIDTSLLVTLQFARGILWCALAWLLARSLSGPSWRAALLVGLAFSGFMIPSLLFPNPFMPWPVRSAHMIEVGTSNFLFGFITALVSIAQPLRELVGVAGPLQQGIAAGASLFEILDEPAEPQGGNYIATRVRGDVEFANVSFNYESGKAAALKDISLQVAAGQSVAIVGRSGSGKSTLVNLLPRFYDVGAGSVRIDRRDVREYDLRSLREQISVVSQDVVLFNDTIRNNIAFGRDVSEEALTRAAEAAHALEFIAEQRDGFNTIVGDRGVLLSGGQRQRISIARALLKDAPILILDEATSALDTEAERHIQAALAQLVRNRTTFIIAHRLSTVEQADRIIVLDAGLMVESGTHAELLSQNGIYSQLHRMQFKA